MRASDSINPPPPEKRHSSFWELLATVASAHGRPLEEKSVKRFRDPLPLPSSCPSGQLWSPRQARATQGSSAVWWRPPTPTPELRAQAHTGALRPRPAEHAAGMKVRRSLGGLHPQGLLFPEEERVSFICSGHQGWGAGRRWRTARVCKPIQGRMGTGAPGGSRRRASEDRLPLPRSPDQPSRSGFHLPKDKPFGSCSGSVRSSLPPSERASVFAATSPKVQGKCGPCRTHLSLFPPPPSV